MPQASPLLVQLHLLRRSLEQLEAQLEQSTDSSAQDEMIEVVRAEVRITLLRHEHDCSQLRPPKPSQVSRPSVAQWRLCSHHMKDLSPAR